MSLIAGSDSARVLVRQQALTAKALTLRAPSCGGDETALRGTFNPSIQESGERRVHPVLALSPPTRVGGAAADRGARETAGSSPGGDATSWVDARPAR